MATRDPDTVVRDGAAALHYLQGPAYERHLIGGIPAAVAELLSLEGLPINTVARVFPPHRSQSFVAELSQALGFRSIALSFYPRRVVITSPPRSPQRLRPPTQPTWSGRETSVC